MAPLLSVRPSRDLPPVSIETQPFHRAVLLHGEVNRSHLGGCSRLRRDHDGRRRRIHLAGTA